MKGGEGLTPGQGVAVELALEGVAYAPPVVIPHLSSAEKPRAAAPLVALGCCPSGQESHHKQRTSTSHLCQAGV